ncbi:hypothetical protein Hanom_Chr10g00892981 [Helianthus anomalus]
MTRIQPEKQAKAEKVKVTLKNGVARVKGFTKKKSKAEKEELAVVEDLKLIERLMEKQIITCTDGKISYKLN